MESFEDLGLNISTHSCLDEYITICEYKRIRSFFDF